MFVKVTLLGNKNYWVFYYFVIGPTNQTQNDDYCMSHGHDFSGNLATYENDSWSQYSSTYIACADGKFVNCMACPNGLVFYENMDWQGNYYDNGHCGYTPVVSKG